MAGINPISAAFLDAALTLGFPVDILQSQISVGELLSATVLPPQNGQDLIEILGQQVSAQLPPTVRPGDVLLLRVTGFSGNQVFVTNLGAYDPANPPEDLPLPSPADSQPQTPQTATLTTIRPAPEQSAAPQAPSSAPAAPETPSVAPPRAVFVAASVTSAQSSRTSNAPASQLPAQAQAQAQAQRLAEANAVEARIAAAQTAKQLATQSAAPRPAVQPPGATQPPLAARVQTAVQSAVANAADAVQRTIRTASDVLRALRLPDTPLARTAAAIAPQAQSRLPSVLARLEAALPRASSDPRIATLRTLVAFVGRMNPQNEDTLTAQISAYVSHAVTGAETKLAQLLQAADQTTPAVLADGEQADGASARASQQQPPGNAAAHRAAAENSVVNQTAAQARVAERSAAIEHDLKSLVLSLLRDPPPSRTPALSQALNEALITLTGTQINVLTNSLNDPGTIAFGLPVFFREGGKPAQIRITRDSSAASGKLDADNFHIAFVLDTANLGTVAVDLQTIGRAVTVDVKTERQAAASQFSRTLDSLRSRLEDLRYRVTSAGAAVAQRAESTLRAVPEPAKETPGLDMRA
ncbi:MAG TPA: flagellar hook-length control protein FliK [Candidatus Baltobacteraceae bacterium]|nr:flagellar hook-length control protein FliK [Candidatus Baltobacteraceae bacterium]